MSKLKPALLVTLLCAARAGAQEQESRAAEIAAEQERKAAEARPAERNRIERALIYFRESNALDRFRDGAAGFRLKLGGLAPGSGFAFGPAFRRTDLLDGQLTVDAGYQASFQGAHKAEARVWLPKLANGRAFAGLYAVRHNYPTLSYYGSGPRSEKNGRSDFRLEDTAFDATAGLYLYAAPHRRRLRRLSVQ